MNALSATETRELNLVGAVNEALHQEMERDERVIVLGEDVALNGGVFRATEGLLGRFGPERVTDTPLAELGIIGAAMGLSIAGFRPVCEIQFDGFTPSIFDQVVSHLGRIRNRTRGRYSLPLVVRSPHGGLIHAPEHHSESPEAHFCHTPGIKVVCPSNPEDAKGLLIAAIRDPDPVIFFEPKALYRAARGPVPKEALAIEIGRARVRQSGSDLTFISWGAMIVSCLKAARKLSEEGVSVEVLDLRTLSPLDKDAILESASKTGRVVIAHEAPNAGSWASEISALISERALLNLKAPVRRVGGWDIRMPLFRLERYYVPDTDRLMTAAKEVLAF